MIDFDLLIRIRTGLKRCRQRLVLVESCTSGLCCAMLGHAPGISEVLCGSFVVYRNGSKSQWLGIDDSLLQNPHIGPVSDEVTRLLACAALERTPEATLAVAITGHLGPYGPMSRERELDGTVFMAIARKNQKGIITNERQQRIELTMPCPQDEQDLPRRQSRQAEAASGLLSFLDHYLESDA
jgi:nicotinamide-nucleotide amidase